MRPDLTSARTRPSLIAPDLLRFACAAAVLWFHLGLQVWERPSRHAAAVLGAAGVRHPGGWPAAEYGWVGVELFFVISGFMIAQSDFGDRATFLRRRLLRLAPAAWICATLTLAFVCAGGTGGPPVALGWLDAIGFVPWGPLVDPSYWTLGIETAFYLAMAFAWHDRPTGERADRLAALLATTGLVFWVTGRLCASGHLVVFGRPAQLLLLPHGAFFTAGIVVARWHAAGPGLARLATAAAALAGGALEIANHARELAIYFAIPFPVAGPLMLVAAGVAVLALAPALQPALERHFTVGTARLIGLATYPLYLIHQEVGASLIAAFAHAGLPLPAVMAVTAATLFAASLAIARWAEPALRHRLDRALRQPRERARPIGALPEPG